MKPSAVQVPVGEETLTRIVPDVGNLETLKVSTGWVDIEVQSEPLVVLTVRGYAPILIVRVAKSGLDYRLYISAKSLAEKLEPLRVNNRGCFRGLKVRIRKAAPEQMSPYELEFL